KRIRDRPLKKLFGWRLERFGGSQVLVELRHRDEEAVDFGVPVRRLSGSPRWLALGDRKRPVVEVADVGEKLERGARGFGGVKIWEVRRRVADGLAATISDGSDGVAEKLANGIGLMVHFCTPSRVYATRGRKFQRRGCEARCPSRTWRLFDQTQPVVVVRITGLSR